MKTLDLAPDLRWCIRPEDHDLGLFGRAWPVGTQCTTIGGIYVHLFALRVGTRDDGIQVAWDDQFQHEVESIQAVDGSALEAMTLMGEGGPLVGDWIIIAHSHGTG